MKNKLAFLFITCHLASSFVVCVGVREFLEKLAFAALDEAAVVTTMLLCLLAGFTVPRLSLRRPRSPLLRYSHLSALRIPAAGGTATHHLWLGQYAVDERSWRLLSIDCNDFGQAGVGTGGE